MKLSSRVPLFACALLVSTGYASFAPTAHAESPTVAVAASGQDNAQESPAANVSGSWQLSWTDNDGNQKQGTLSIQQDGSKLSGSFTGPRGTFPLSGSIQGSHVSLTLGPARHQLTLTGDVDGNKMTGTTPQGKAWSADKQ